MSTDSGAPLLFTPGPLTISDATRSAMARQDWGSRDPRFIDMNRRILDQILRIAEADDGSYVCVPVPGSGTYALEAMAGSLIPRTGSKVLLLINGAYGRRMAAICKRIGLAYHAKEYFEDEVPTVEEVEELMTSSEGPFTHVTICHCETSAGVLNPVAEIAEVVNRHHAFLMVDAMSAFAAIPLPPSKVKYLALASSANKCLEGAPGLAFVIVQKSELAKCENRSHSLSLDLFEQHKGIEANGQYRFTPPTHCIAALDHAIQLYLEEGGLEARRKRYEENFRILSEGMEKLGFKRYLRPEIQSPVIVSYFYPRDKNFNFTTFYESLATRGFVIYPGKLTKLDTFRIGCIGRLVRANIEALLDAVVAVLKEMNVTEISPAE